MNVTMDLLHIVEQAHSPERMLEPATRVVAERMRVDGCVVHLLDEHRNLVRGPRPIGLAQEPRDRRRSPELTALLAPRQLLPRRGHRGGGPLRRLRRGHARLARAPRLRGAAARPPVRHGEEAAVFVARLGRWWGELLTSLRERAEEPPVT